MISERLQKLVEEMIDRGVQFDDAVYEFEKRFIVRVLDRNAGSLIKSAELGQALATTIGDGVGCLIPRHGLVTVGPDTATAVMRAVLLARACQVQLQAMAAGGIRVWSDSAEIALKKADVWPESQFNAGYAYLCREAG